MSLKSEKLLQDLFDEVHDSFEYWADARIEEIEKRELTLELKPAESKALQALIKTPAGCNALKKLLMDCGESNLFSTFTYIDGCTGIKLLELVNAHTGIPIAEHTLHEYFSSYCRDFERLNQ